MADSITNEPNDSDFLVMATALHGLSEEAMSKGSRNITACGRLILQQTLYWQNRWTKDTRFALYGDMNNTKVSDLYETLISMTCCDDPYIVGYGNLGDGERPPAYPSYVAFGLTERGRRYAESLFNRLPHFRSPEPIPD